MYLKRIRAQNFRVFGDGDNSPALDWELSEGINILVGENDAGKTAVIDAIRQILWTTSYESIRLLEHDFHVLGGTRAGTLFIEATLCDLSEDQQAAVLDWLTYETDGTCSLIVHLSARWIAPNVSRRGRVEAITRAGRDGAGGEIGAAVREIIRSTYLKPLRDAEAELRPGRMSRLSQILGAHQLIDGQEQNDFDVVAPETIPSKLVGLMAFAQHHIGQHEVIKGVQKDINENYLEKFAFAGDNLSSRIRIAPELSLTPILERFELALLPANGIHPEQKCVRGLGYNNALFMATELVLLRDGEELGLLLIEEPEAHLHPQLQERVMRMLEEHAEEPNEGGRRVQVIMSTHSPSLAAGAKIEQMTLVHKGRIYSLAPEKTKLKKTDYTFLRRFIDATKANLFFAKAVVIVEGPAEALLLPALSEAVGRSFSRYGVSIVNVGGVGLFHYARILQRADEGVVMPIPVACLTDRDIVPDEAAEYVERPAKKQRFDSDYSAMEMAEVVRRKEVRAAGGSTIVCVSDRWTFEYDLALHGCAELMHLAIRLAVQADKRGERLSDEEEAAETIAAGEAWKRLTEAGHSLARLAAIIYRPLHDGDASKAIAAQYAASLISSGKFGTGDALLTSLPPYIQRAIQHVTALR